MNGANGPKTYSEAFSDSYVEQLMAGVMARNPGEAEFHQAVREVTESVEVVYRKNPQYAKLRVFEDRKSVV